MNKTLMLIGMVAGSLMASVVGAHADVRVRGHVRSNGSYVAPHYRSNPDGYSYNNWSYAGNYNPYTGQNGYRNNIYGSGNRYGTSDMLYRSAGSSCDRLGRSRGSSRLYY